MARDIEREDKTWSNTVNVNLNTVNSLTATIASSDTYIFRIGDEYHIVKNQVQEPLDINTLSDKMKARALDIEEGKEYKIL